MRLTLHSARVGGGRHNDRNFDLKKASHIVETESNKNIYLNYLGDDSLSFHESELKFYQDHFKDFIKDKNDRAIKAGHSERIVDAEALLKSNSRYRPEEVIIQVGDKNNSIDSKELIEAFSEFLEWHDWKFKDNIKSLNIALHVDESTPHIHWRRVWQYDDNKGFKAIGQHKALEQLGYELPDTSKQRDRFNNLKVVYTKECREKFLEICKNRNLEIEEQSKYRSKENQNLKKTDFIINKQNEELERLKDEISIFEQDKTLLQKELEVVEFDIQEYTAKQNELLQQNEHLRLINNEQVNKINKNKNKLQQIEEFERNKLKLETINKVFQEKVKVKTFFNSDKVRVEKSELMTLMQIAKELDERFKALEDRERSLNTQSEQVLSNAKKQAKMIIQTASEQSLSLNDKVKLAKYEQLVGDDKLKELEDLNKHRTRQRTRDININKDLER